MKTFVTVRFDEMTGFFGDTYEDVDYEINDKGRLTIFKMVQEANPKYNPNAIVDIKDYNFSWGVFDSLSACSSIRTRLKTTRTLQRRR